MCIMSITRCTTYHAASLARGTTAHVCDTEKGPVRRIMATEEEEEKEEEEEEEEGGRIMAMISHG